MNRYLLARMIVVLATVAAFLPFLPAENKNNPIGLGGVQRAMNINRMLSREPPDSVARNARIRYQGRMGPVRVAKLLHLIDTVKEQAGIEPGTEPGTVHARGFLRKELWALAYDLYPVRVKGAFLEEGGSPKDPVHSEAGWVLTLERDSLTLERQP